MNDTPQVSVSPPSAPLPPLSPWPIPVATAMRRTIARGYHLRELRADVTSGVVVGIVALPLAMALAIAVGVAPQHGLYTAIVAGAVVALLGGSRTQVTGPTAAFIVILAPIVAQVRARRPADRRACMAGVHADRDGARPARRADPVHPASGDHGIHAGIATVIATLQLKDVLGLQPRQHARALRRAHRSRCGERAARRRSRSSAIAALTLALLVWLPRLDQAGAGAAGRDRRSRRSSAALLSCTSRRRSRWRRSRSRFHTTVGGVVVDGIPPLPPLPMLPWHLPGPDGQRLAFARRCASWSPRRVRHRDAGRDRVAAVGGRSPTAWPARKHDPDAELVALGIGNVVAPFFGGIPATGAIARTATNIRSGARSPIAAIVHALSVLLAVLAAGAAGRLPADGLARGAAAAGRLEHVRGASTSSTSCASRRGATSSCSLTCFGLTVVVRHGRRGVGRASCWRRCSSCAAWPS